MADILNSAMSAGHVTLVIWPCIYGGRDICKHTPLHVYSIYVQCNMQTYMTAPKMNKCTQFLLKNKTTLFSPGTFLYFCCVPKNGNTDI